MQRKVKINPNEIGDTKRGERLFKTLCMGCHAMSMRGIYGKHIASGSM